MRFEFKRGDNARSRRIRCVDFCSFAFPRVVTHYPLPLPIKEQAVGSSAPTAPSSKDLWQRIQAVLVA